jgi:hypothetical protein
MYHVCMDSKLCMKNKLNHAGYDRSICKILFKINDYIYIINYQQTMKLSFLFLF